MGMTAGHRYRSRPNVSNEVVAYFRMALAVQHKFLSTTYGLKGDFVPFVIPSLMICRNDRVPK